MSQQLVEDLNGKRWCSGCEQWKPLDRFKVEKGYRVRRCRDCRYQETRRPDRVEARRAYNREAVRRSRERRRREAIDKLGGACTRCGFSDYRALQIDHVNGGGNVEIKKYGSTWTFRQVLAGKPGYQVLCANCNWIKRHENGEVSPCL